MRFTVSSDFALRIGAAIAISLLASVVSWACTARSIAAVRGTRTLEPKLGKRVSLTDIPRYTARGAGQKVRGRWRSTGPGLSKFTDRIDEFCAKLGY